MECCQYGETWKLTDQRSTLVVLLELHIRVTCDCAKDYGRKQPQGLNKSFLIWEFFAICRRLPYFILPAGNTNYMDLESNCESCNQMQTRWLNAGRELKTEINRKLRFHDSGKHEPEFPTFVKNALLPWLFHSDQIKQLEQGNEPRMEQTWVPEDCSAVSVCALRKIPPEELSVAFTGYNDNGKLWRSAACYFHQQLRGILHTRMLEHN